MEHLIFEIVCIQETRPTLNRQEGGRDRLIIIFKHPLDYKSTILLCAYRISFILLYLASINKQWFTKIFYLAYPLAILVLLEYM